MLCAGQTGEVRDRGRGGGVEGGANASEDSGIGEVLNYSTLVLFTVLSNTFYCGNY